MYSEGTSEGVYERTRRLLLEQGVVIRESHLFRVECSDRLNLTVYGLVSVAFLCGV